MDDILYQICYTGATGICTENNKYVYKEGFGISLVKLKQLVIQFSRNFQENYLNNPDYRSKFGFKEEEELNDESVNQIKQDFINYLTDKIEGLLGFKLSDDHIAVINKEAENHKDIFERMEYGGRRRKQKRRTIKRRNKRRLTKKRNYRKKRRTVRKK